MGSHSVGGAEAAGDTLARPSSERSGGTWWVLLGLFALVALSVELGWWTRVDRSLDDWLTSRRVELLWSTAKVVFDVADPELVLPTMLVLGLVVACWRHQRIIAIEAVMRIGLVLAAVLVLKPLFAVPGPTRNSLGAHGGAFPSGHTATAVVCVALLLVWVGRPRSPAGRVAVNAVAVAVVGGSAVYLHYHYISETVGGAVLGALIATLPCRLPRRGAADRRTAPRR